MEETKNSKLEQSRVSKFWIALKLSTQFCCCCRLITMKYSFQIPAKHMQYSQPIKDVIFSVKNVHYEWEWMAGMRKYINRYCHIPMQPTAWIMVSICSWKGKRDIQLCLSRQLVVHSYMWLLARELSLFVYSKWNIYCK